MSIAEANLMHIYELLEARYGHLGWWPAETALEVCVGAILTQNTAWTNVEKAIQHLKRADKLSVQALHEIAPDVLAGLIRPAGFFNVKSKRLKAFISWLQDNYQGSLQQLFSHEWQQVRLQLLNINGIGPETADSMLLYAGEQPSFVVDSYTRRLFSRVGLLSDTADYNETRDMFMGTLKADVALFNQYHALIVEQCKQHCRVIPRCCGCPLAECCRFFNKQDHGDI